jgi:2-polyprenyl-3-methyl-5-hydroxy-6-metoxy-1,4-benzoquinol methylase
MIRVPSSKRKANIPSPLTGGPSTLSASLKPQVIIDRYAADGIDVARYFEGVGTVDIYRCSNSGFRFFHPPSLAGEADFYEQIYDPTSDHDIADPDYREWGEDYQYAFERIVPGEQLLDVGCGFGYFLRRAGDKADVTGVDGNKFAQARCKALGLKVHLGEIGDYRDRFCNAFDLVCCFQVLEHVYNVGPFIRDLVAAVRPGGRLIIAVPNNEPYLRRYDPYVAWNCPPHHVGLWNRQSLEAMALIFGLEVVEHQYCEVSGRWTVEAYLHARSLLRITEEIHDHNVKQKLMMAALLPYTICASLFRHFRQKGQGTRGVIAMTFRKPTEGTYLVA